MTDNRRDASCRSARTLRFRKKALALALGQALALGAPAALAATITVDSTSGGTGGPNCTLPDAMTAANSDTATGGCPAGSGADTILLPASATLNLSASLPVTSTITIQGNGATIQGNNSFSIFGVNRWFIDS